MSSGTLLPDDALRESKVLGACTLRDFEIVRVAGVGRRGACFVARCRRAAAAASGAAAAAPVDRLYALKLVLDATDGSYGALLRAPRPDVTVASRAPSHPAIAEYLACFIDAPSPALLALLPADFGAAFGSCSGGSSSSNSSIGSGGVCDRHLRQFAVFEYIDGLTLEEYLDADAPRGVPAGTLRHLARSLLGALAALAAAGIVHRDVEPDNVMVARRGDGGGVGGCGADGGALEDGPCDPTPPRFVLIDLGLAVEVDPATMEDGVFEAGGLPGGSNRCFHAPEVLNVAARAARAAAGGGGGRYHVMPYAKQDVFALGVVLFEAASCGAHPLPGYPDAYVGAAGDVRYDDASIAALPEGCWCAGAAMEALVRRMLCCDPAARVSAAQALEMLEVTS